DEDVRHPPAATSNNRTIRTRPSTPGELGEQASYRLERLRLRISKQARSGDLLSPTVTIQPQRNILDPPHMTTHPAHLMRHLITKIEIPVGDHTGSKPYLRSEQVRHVIIERRLRHLGSMIRKRILCTDEILTSRQPVEPGIRNPRPLPIIRLNQNMSTRNTPLSELRSRSQPADNHSLRNVNTRTAATRIPQQQIVSRVARPETFLRHRLSTQIPLVTHPLQI